MSEPTWTFSQQFYAQFQESCSKLASRLESAKLAAPSSDVLQELSLDLTKLSKTLADATGSLPSYDQRQCELQLKALEKSLEELRSSSIPKSKFAFKRKAVKASESPAPLVPASISASVTTNEVTQAASLLIVSNAQSTNQSLSSRSHQYLTVESLPPVSSSSDRSDLTISDLDGCVVNFLGLASPSEETIQLGSPSVTARKEISALHISNLRNTVLLLPKVEGSVLLHDLSRCIVVVGCHQFRMHDSRNVNVYLTIPSNPVIEHCSRIRFAGYPTSFIRSVDEGDGKSSSHLAVQDFSHIRPTPSPNWSILDNNSRIDEWLQLVIGDRQKLHEMLEELL